MGLTNVKPTLLTLSILLLTLPARLAAGAERPTPVDFARDVQPILEKHCVRCHGSTKRRSGLRLDIKASALKGGDVFGPSIVPGKAAESPLIQFISGEDADLTMPPKSEGLSVAEVETLTRWVDEGASWPGEAGREETEDRGAYWSFQPLTDPVPPRGLPRKRGLGARLTGSFSRGWSRRACGLLRKQNGRPGCVV